MLYHTATELNENYYLTIDYATAIVYILIKSMKYQKQHLYPCYEPFITGWFPNFLVPISDLDTLLRDKYEEYSTLVPKYFIFY